MSDHRFSNASAPRSTIPEQAGIHAAEGVGAIWVPACAGMADIFALDIKVM